VEQQTAAQQNTEQQKAEQEQQKVAKLVTCEGDEAKG